MDGFRRLAVDEVVHLHLRGRRVGRLIVEIRQLPAVTVQPLEGRQDGSLQRRRLACARAAILRAPVALSRQRAKTTLTPNRLFTDEGVAVV
jgi:hypothetical protein